jgi:hypothetical protein
MDAGERTSWSNPIEAQRIVEALEERLLKPVEHKSVDEPPGDHLTPDDPETPD